MAESNGRSFLETQKKIIAEQIRKEKPVMSSKIVILKDAKNLTATPISELSF